MKKIIAIIPARMGSSRYPGKPLEEILGIPMIGRVYQRVSECEALTQVVVATCDKEIFDYVLSIGGRAVITGDHHDRASDRCAEALIRVEKDDHIKYDVIVMVQGDEPLVCAEMINEALEPILNDESVLVTNLLGEIKELKEFEDRNCIKVVCDLNMDALYFSREPIPTMKYVGLRPIGKQVCIIPFKREFLITYTELKPTPLEIIESIDMLRVLESGYKVRMVPTKYPAISVDTKEDLLRVEQYLVGLK